MVRGGMGRFCRLFCVGIGIILAGGTTAIATQPAPLLEGRIYFNTGVVDLATRVNLLNQPGAVPDETAPYVLSLQGAVTEERREALAAVGVRLWDYLPVNAFIARFHETSFAAVSNLGFVTFVGDFDAAWKIDPELGTRSYVTGPMQEIVSAGRLPVTVTLFADSSADDAMNAIRAIPGARIDRAEPMGDGFEIAAELPADQIAGLAEITSVQYIEPAYELTLRNSSNRWIVQSNVTNVTPLYDNGIHGEGQVVGVLDGRADQQHCSLSGGKILFYNASDGNDTHGTHVSCTAVGNAGVNDNTRGVAYLGNMVYNVTPSFTESAVNTALTTHSSQGARIHTNSWGDDGTTSYNALCRGFDLFGYQHEDELVCLAVTNTSTLRNPENAKNLLAVGASQDTPSQASHCSGGTGPTADGRRKPEIYAPGCNTTSAVPGTCGTANLTGTSMASPAVAGTGALVRQYYADGYYPSGVAIPGDGFTPSGALIKATLLNSAVDMTGISGYPSNQEGWGRVLADNALYFNGDTRRLVVLSDIRNAEGLTTGQSNEHSFQVTSNAEQLRVTLVWTDAPASASTGTAAAAVNNLDLTVIAPGGQTYRGNVFSGGVSVTGGAADSLNNVEQVHLNSPATGLWTVTVSGAAVNSGAQGYALIATGAVIDQAPALAITLPGGPPAELDPGVAAVFDVSITSGEENVVPGSEKLFYRLDGGAFNEAPLANLGGGNYQATLPGPMCDDVPQFYVSATGDGSTTVTSPPGAPGNFYTATVGQLETPFADNFQTNMLWSVASAPNGGGTFSGLWERAVPSGGGVRGDPATDADGSGQCYVTQNGAGDTDVDNGSTTLTSPAVDISNLLHPEVSYYRWFNNNFSGGAQQDTFRVQVSSNNGLSWTLLETVGPTTASQNPEVNGGWILKTYSLDGIVTPTAQFRIRFIAEDAGTGQVVEAGVDGVQVRGRACEDVAVVPEAPTGVAATDGDNCLAVNVSWNASASANDYEVWRNTVDNSGTAASIASGVAATSFDDSTASFGTTYFYWVKACNAGGCSGLSGSDAGSVGLAGDFNLDGNVDGADIQGFVEANVLSPFYDDCADLAAPLGTLDVADVDAFVTMLLGS